METRTLDISTFDSMRTSIEEQQDACRRSSAIGVVGWETILGYLNDAADFRASEISDVALPITMWAAIDEFGHTIDAPWAL